MKRALFISHVPPFPAIGGDRLRIAQSLRLLTEMYDVDIAYLTKDRDGKPMRTYLPSIKDERRFYSARWKRYARAAKTLFNGKSLTENHFRSSALLSHVKRVASGYDLIFCASPVCAQYAVDMGATPKALDMIDSLTMNFANAAARARGWKRLFFREESRRMERYERRCCREFRSVAYISPIDRDWLDTGNANKHIVGNAAKSFGGMRSKHDMAPRHLVFVGKMDYEPNIVATTFFAREVMPLLRERMPGVRFSIVGVSPTPEVRALAEEPGVEVTGFVESLDPWFENASLVVAPMLSGSGVQNKILEALGHGCAVLTTPIGLEGIESLADVLEVVDGDASVWADVITAILRNPARTSMKAGKAAARVEEEFGISRIRLQFQKFIEGAST